MKKLKLLIIYLCLSISVIFPNEDLKGIIRGQVLDSENQLPLTGANILVNKNNLGTISDENGFFILENIPQGYYNISISYIGYKLKILNDVWVRPRAHDFLSMTLDPKVLKLEGISVEESYFSKSIVNEYQSISFNNDEIRRAPGAGQEISRILNSLPSVASVGENRQDMMVRGGGPTENGFIIDNIYIPSISHFQQADGRSNGPVGIINTDMVENLDFYSNGFSSKYGNKLSSFGDITYRSGNREKNEGYGLLGMGGLGFLIEGPLTNKVSYITSFRMSYLDIIADAINASGGMPSYNDFQAKINYKPSIYNTFSILMITGSSLYDRDKNGALDVGESEYGKLENDQQTVGINYKRIWNEKAYSNSSLSISNKFSKVNFSNINTDSSVFKNIEKTDIVNFRQVNHIKLASQTNIELGFDAQWTNQNYDYLRKLNDSNILLDKIKFDEKVLISNYSTFFTLKKDIGRKLVSSIGFRTDLNDYENKTLFSPRMNLDYEIIHEK